MYIPFAGRGGGLAKSVGDWLTTVYVVATSPDTVTNSHKSHIMKVQNVSVYTCETCIHDNITKLNVLQSKNLIGSYIHV